MKILIINSDSPNNRGDRAILAGNIALIREAFPDAEIWSQSEYAERDAKWYGINFLPISAYTTNPLHLMKLCFFARKCDYVLWGGGEILKDYTNKIGLIYWAVKMTGVRLCNKNLFGAFQGIGPTQAPISKKLIAYSANLTQSFIVRDEESKQKLERWGVRAPIVSSVDPAVIETAQTLDTATKKILKKTYGIDDAFLKNTVGIGVRKWFHYKKSTWLPFRFKLAHKKSSSAPNPKLQEYTKNLAELCDWVVEKHDVNIIFFPMHMASSENDASFSRSVIALMKHSDRTKVIDQDNLSPQEYQNVVGQCRFFIGSRLHSSILATSANIPSIVFYYVDKGRLFFEQIGMQRFSQPIEDLLDHKNLSKVKKQINTLVDKKSAIKKELSDNIDTMRKRVIADFKKGLRLS